MPFPDNLFDEDGKIKRGVFKQAQTTYLENDYDNCWEVLDYTNYCYVRQNEGSNGKRRCSREEIKMSDFSQKEIDYFKIKEIVIDEIYYTECGTKEVNVTLIDTQAFENTVMISELKEEVYNLNNIIIELIGDNILMKASLCKLGETVWC